MAIDLTTNNITAMRWSSLKLYNAYRLVLALLLLITQGLVSSESLWQSINSSLLASLFSTVVTGYFIFSLISATFTWIEKPNIDINLPIQIIIDIGFIVMLMHAQDGSQSSIGLLLIIAVAAVSLISEGRLALFYAAVASIGILFEQFYRNLSVSSAASNYTSAVLLSLGCFATAWLAYSLAKRTKQSELLASQRGLDVQNLAQINALITDEMHDGVLVVNQALQVKHYNHQAKSLLGLEKDHWQDKLLNEISPEIANLLQLWVEETAAINGFEPTNPAMPNFLKLTALSRELRLRFLPIAENRLQGAVIFISDRSQMQTQAHQVKLAAL